MQTIRLSTIGWCILKSLQCAAHLGTSGTVINSQVIVLLEQQNTVYCRGIYSGNNVKIGDTIPD